ncbi:glycosyltransferase 87 family protein [Corynebacterium uropygiale]|uniref:Glycosyltransferase 87 family protein n=1 Tax=Corynebacterium uropygiale TaxID=1775911 RepID=A0A9X1QT04_9CORY|nr:glycosyltransferase 87 family protein [Corynebacterium uropygiale]MCF4007690.1 glycosyltransferase 87 family protein [Corynebacterium uropygiale]
MRIGPAESRVPAIGREPAARSWGEFLGGPLGPHAAVGRQRWWTPLRVLIALAVAFCSFGYAQKSPCFRSSIDEKGIASLDWSGFWQYTTACYNDIIPLFAGRGLNTGGFPYAYSWQEDGLTRYLEYPVATGYFQGIMGAFGRMVYRVLSILPGATPPPSVIYFTITAGFLSLLWVLGIIMLAELAGNRVWDVVLIAASPVLIVHAFTNWDIPSIVCVIAALWFVRRRRPGLAGVMLGLGTAFKLWPLYAFGAFLVLAVRNRRARPFLRMLAGGVVSWILLNLPVMLLYPEAWSEFLRLNRERSWEWTTIYAVLARATGWSGFDASSSTPTVLNTVSFLLFAGACLAIAGLGLGTRRTPRVAELLFLIVAAFLLVNKVWSPQYSLWLVVPAVLALPRWRLLLAWMCSEVLVWPILTWHMMGADHHGLPGWVLNIAVLCRDGLIIAIAVLVVAQMLGKVKDKVEEAHAGRDPLAGDFGPRSTSEADESAKETAAP